MGMIYRGRMPYPAAASRRIRMQTAFTLIEVMLSILIVMVLVTGAMGYQYFSARDVKLAEVHTSAARLALLLESWKGVQGDAGFDPVSTFAGQLDIQSAQEGPPAATNTGGALLTCLGFYQVQLNGVCYYVTPAWQPPSDLEPMVLNVTIAWRRDYRPGPLTGDEPLVRYSAFLVQN